MYEGHLVVWADYVGWMKDRAEDVMAIIAAANSPFIPHDRNDSLVSMEDQATDRPGTSASGLGNQRALSEMNDVNWNWNYRGCWQCCRHPYSQIQRRCRSQNCRYWRKRKYGK